MEQVLRVLGKGCGAGRARFPIAWSDQRKASLRNIERGLEPSANSVDVALATPLLKCADGRFEEAERDIRNILGQNIAEYSTNYDTFISLLNAVFVVQRLDVAAEMLRSRYGFGGDFEIDVQRGGPGNGRVRWDILPSGASRFTFDENVYKTDETRTQILAFQWEFPIFAHYSCKTDINVGSIIINQEDIGRIPGLAYCDSRPEYFLIPDCIFIPTKGYEYARKLFRENHVTWSDRISQALWRGSTTGVPASPGDWHSLERVKLCELALRNEHTGVINAGLSGVVQFDDPAIVAEIQNSGLLRDFVPWQIWNRYKYHIDIDGNSSPWSNLFQRLLTGGTVLKVESSRGLRQWFYDELIPWQNYVPVAPDMWDLMDKIKWLTRNDATAQRIGQRGFELAQRLTYERELDRSIGVISAAFRYFRNEYCDAAPCGLVGF